MRADLNYFRSSFRCTDGTCVSISVVCDHQSDCLDNTDETLCRKYIPTITNVLLLYYHAYIDGSKYNEPIRPRMFSI